MTSRENPLLREAMRVREEGDLARAMDMLRGQVDPAADPAFHATYLRLLFGYQDYVTLQAETRRALAAPVPAEMAPEDLTTLLRFAERCCLPAAAIRDALAATAPAARKATATMTAWRAVSHRQRFRQTLADRYEGGASIISLGLNCLPWHLPGRWGLRREADFDRLFVPFSLAGHTVEGAIGALEDDFATYCTPETVRAVTSQRGHEFAMRKDRGAFWNHNRGTWWLKDEMAALRADCARKAANFRAACKRPDVVFLMGTCPVEYPAEPLDFLPRLQAALARFTGTAENRILISNQTAYRAKPIFRRVDATTAYICCPYPSKEYVWHDDEAADAREGLIFERSFMSFVLRALVNWGLMSRRDAPGSGDDLADAA